MIRPSPAVWLVAGSVALLACGGGSSSDPSQAGKAGSGAAAGSSGSAATGGSAGSGACQAQIQTGTRTECDWSQGISDPDIACDDVPVYGYVDGAQCAGACVDLKTSAAHCGECGNACDTTNAWYCKDGECTDPRQGSGGSGGSGGAGAGAAGGAASGGSAGSGSGPPQLPDLANLQISVGYAVSDQGECAADIGCAYDVNVCLQAKNGNFLSVQNLGYVDAPPFALALAFEETSGERRPCAMESPITTTAALAPLGTFKTTDEFCCTANLLLPRQYRLTLIADPDDAVPEYDENNNVGSTPLVSIAP